MHKTSHAQEISARFKQRVEQTGDSLPEEHYDELALLIEAGIDTVLVEYLEGIADQLLTLSKTVRSNAERFN